MESTHMLRAGQRGVTLLELMIVAAVVAILAAIAYPSYQDQVRRSRRAKAQAFKNAHWTAVSIRERPASADDLRKPSQVSTLWANWFSERSKQSSRLRKA
jgi:prepilin-type N-terminal cleavage/methylation domain-containing protein